MYSEVAIANIASVKAHEKIGFKRISKKLEDQLKEKGLVYKRNMMLVKKY
jgi:RimJ/RimL family protein N-acetyltransferase